MFGLLDSAYQLSKDGTITKAFLYAEITACHTNKTKFEGILDGRVCKGDCVDPICKINKFNLY